MLFGETEEDMMAQFGLPTSFESTKSKGQDSDEMASSATGARNFSSRPQKRPNSNTYGFVPASSEETEEDMSKLGLPTSFNTTKGVGLKAVASMPMATSTGEDGTSKSGRPLYCELCDSQATGLANYEAHLAGSKHQKNLKRQAEGAPLTKNKNKTKSGVYQKPRRLKQIIDDMPDTIFIGLQYITEFQPEDPTEDARYVCNLCEAKCDPRTIVGHVTGLKHRLGYMKEHFMDYHMQIKQQAEKKSDQTPLVERFARMIEEQEGRLDFKVRHDLEFYQSGQPGVPSLLEPSAKRLRRGNSNFGDPGFQAFGSTAEFQQELDSFLMRTTGKPLGGMGLLLKSLLELLNDGCSLETEEEAGMALKVSNSLTHALLDYRLKSVPANMRDGLDDIESPMPRPQGHPRDQGYGMGGGPGRNAGGYRGGRGGRDGHFRGGPDRNNYDGQRERGGDDGHVGMNFITDVLKNIREGEQDPGQQGGYGDEQVHGGYGGRQGAYGGRQGGYGGGQGGYGGGQGGYGGGRQGGYGGGGPGDYKGGHRPGFGYSYGERY